MHLKVCIITIYLAFPFALSFAILMHLMHNINVGTPQYQHNTSQSLIIYSILFSVQGKKEKKKKEKQKFKRNLGGEKESQRNN